MVYLRKLILFLMILLFMAPSALCAIPSSGTKTALGFLSELPDSAFKISFSEGNGVKNQNPNFKVEVVSVDTFKVLGAADVQSSVARLWLAPGAFFPSHTHPRAAETVYLQSGRMRVTVRFEGLDTPRLVSNVLSPGQVTVFPQGLAHESRCVSEEPCVCIGFLNSGDPGITLAPPF